MNYKLYENSLNDPKRVIETILLNRGITDPEAYLNLNESCCNDYENLDNIDAAVKLFDFHFERRDDVGILVDPDV